MSSESSHTWLGLKYPLRYARMMIPIMLLAIIVYMLAFPIYLPLMLLVAELGFIGLVISFSVVSVAIGVLAYRSYRKTLSKWLKDADEVTRENHPELSETLSLIEKESDERNMETPTIYVHPSSNVNALAVGRRNNGKILLFNGLLSEINSTPEINAVVGHELAHIDNRDSSLMSLIIGIKELILWGLTSFGVLVRGMVHRQRGTWHAVDYDALRQTCRRKSRQIMFPMNLCEASISRHREYIADAEGAKVASPEAMIGALETIENTQQDTSSEEYHQSLCILSKHNGILSSLRSTHPPTQKRIKNIKK